MRVVMNWNPVVSTDIAKLVLASAGHLVASLILFNHDAAFSTTLVF